MKLTGASFAISADSLLGDNFHGWVEPARVRFFLNPYDNRGEFLPFVVEHIGDTNYLIIEGEASVDLPTTRWTGILAGSLKLFATSPIFVRDARESRRVFFRSASVHAVRMNNCTFEVENNWLASALVRP